MKDLNPEICRKRLVVEGYYGVYLNKKFLVALLEGLGKAIDMKVIAGPFIFSPNRFSKLHHGLGGFVAWAESGASFYSWSSYKFFTIDIYSCKTFSIDQVLTYIKDELQCEQFDWSKVEYEE